MWLGLMIRSALIGLERIGWDRFDHIRLSPHNCFMAAPRIAQHTLLASMHSDHMMVHTPHPAPDLVRVFQRDCIHRCYHRKGLF